MQDKELDRIDEYVACLHKKLNYVYICKMTPKLYAASLKRINSEGEACPITLDCCKRLLEKVVSKIAQGLSDMDGRRGNVQDILQSTLLVGV